MNDMNGSMLAGIKAAEDMLAREQSKQQKVDAQGILNNLPDNHPLVTEFNKNPSLVEDLGDLPAGHPLLKALTEAKQRHDEMVETEEAQDHAAEKRVNKQSDKRKADTQRMVEEEADRQGRKMAAKTINDQIVRATGQLESLYYSMQDLSSTFENDPYCKVKLKKLDRLLCACKRGLDECRISTTRI